MSSLVQHTSAIARLLLGEPNKGLSKKTELRFGNNGSMSVDLLKGTWYDNELKEGGGIVDLIKRGGHEPREWLASHGFGDDPRPSNPKGGDQRNSKPAPGERKVLEATFDYTDETGELLYQTLRYNFVGPDGQPVTGKDGKPKKTFSQRRKAQPGDEPEKVHDGWFYSVKGVRLVPYRLPELQEAVAMDRTIFIPDSFAEFFAGADVILLPDNDEPGTKHADMIGANLTGAARSIRLLQLPALPPKGDVIDWLDGGGTLDRLDDLAAKARALGDRPIRFGAVWFSETQTHLEDPEWLVDDLLTRGDKSLVYGPSQSGKSFLATHIAMGIARGEGVLGRKVKRGGVVYIAGEGKKGFKKRLQAYRQEHDLAEDYTLPFLLIPTALDLYNEDGDIGPLIEELSRITPTMEAMGVQIELVVIDTLAAVSPGANENASEDMSRILKHCDRIQEVTNGHVMIVHHKNAAGDRPRGHTSLFAACDNAIEVMCDEYKLRTAKIAKLKDGEDGTSINFRLQSVTIGTRDDGKPITSCVVAPSEAQERTSNARGVALTPQTRVALQALRFVINEYGEPAPATLKLAAGVRVVNYRLWADRFAKTSFDGDDANPEAVKKALQRAGTQLLSRNVIGRNNPYVWIVREPEGTP
jgi:hypothetical protein